MVQPSVVFRSAIILALLLFLLPLPAARAAEPSAEIRITGSSTIKPVVMVATRIVGKKHNVRFNVSSGSGSDGVREVAERKAELGMATRYLVPEEIIKYPDLRYNTIGFDGIALIVNRDNPVSNLTRQQVVDLLTGAVRNWSQAGGPNLPVEVVSMENTGSAGRIYMQYFGLATEGSGKGQRFVRSDGKAGATSASMYMVRQNTEAILRVGETKGAVAFMSMSAAHRMEVKLGAIKTISLDDVAASRENIRSKAYPLVMPLNLVTLGVPQGYLKVFVDYMLSGYGQNIVKNLDYTPIR